MVRGKLELSSQMAPSLKREHMMDDQNLARHKSDQTNKPYAKMHFSIDTSLCRILETHTFTILSQHCLLEPPKASILYQIRTKSLDLIQSPVLWVVWKPLDFHSIPQTRTALCVRFPSHYLPRTTGRRGSILGTFLKKKKKNRKENRKNGRQSGNKNIFQIVSNRS